MTMFKKFTGLMLLTMLAAILAVSPAIGVFAENAEPRYLEEYSYDFENEGVEDGTMVDETASFTDFFVFNCAGSVNVSGAKFMTEGDNRYIEMWGYNALMSSMDIIDYPYEFSVDIRHGEVGANQYFGIFARGVMPGQMKIKNPDNGNIQQTFPYYESDWYGGTEKQRGIGGSGIFLVFAKDRVSVGAKVYVEDYLTIAEERVDVQLPASYRLGEFNNFKMVEDSSEKISIYINDELLAMVRFSDPGAQYGDNTDLYFYYETAEILDAEGNVLKTIKNTRINCDGSQIAVGSRFVNLAVDNLYVGMGMKTANATEDPGNAQETQKPEETTDNTEPAQKPEETQNISEATEEPTEAPKTEAPKDSSGGISAGVVIGIVAGVAVIAAVVTVIVIKKKKK